MLAKCIAALRILLEVVLEIEHTFDILQVIELRPSEKMERIEGMVGVYPDRERVACILG